MPKKKTKEEFIKEATEKHEGKYDYTKVDYVNDRTKVCIICPNPEHGEFWQRPSNHLTGNGCPICGIEKCSEKNRKSFSLSKEEFINRANEKHEGKYKYNKVDYVNAFTKVCIICKNHGEFWQTPNSHTRGSGCRKCANEENSKSFRSSLHEFVKKVRKVHGDKYDYSKVDYVNDRTKVCIICLEHEHGEFCQTPSSHLQGNGCPKCNLSHLERDVMNYLDDAGINYDYQKRFDWLGRQSLDFYLPDYNVGIECQGGQHFFPVEHFGGNKEFKKILVRDKRKKVLCEEHGIKLMYFGNVPNYDTFLGEVVHDDVQYLIDYLEEHKKENT